MTEKHLCCLMCGKHLNRRGWGRHQTQKSHVNRGDLWWKYSRISRMIELFYAKAMLVQMKQNFAFMRVTGSSQDLPIREGRTIQWYKTTINRDGTMIHE